MGTVETVFAVVVSVLAALAVIGALVFTVVWEVCAIRRTLAGHRRHRPAASLWREHAMVPAATAEHELIREGVRRILAGNSPLRIALDWKGRSSYGQRRP